MINKEFVHSIYISIVNQPSEKQNVDLKGLKNSVLETDIEDFFKMIEDRVPYRIYCQTHPHMGSMSKAILPSHILSRVNMMEDVKEYFKDLLINETNKIDGWEPPHKRDLFKKITGYTLNYNKKYRKQQLLGLAFSNAFDSLVSGEIFSDRVLTV